MDLVVVEAKFARHGSWKLAKTNVGEQVSPRWLWYTLVNMLESGIDRVMDTATLLALSLEYKLVRVGVFAVSRKSTNYIPLYDARLPHIESDIYHKLMHALTLSKSISTRRSYKNNYPTFSITDYYNNMMKHWRYFIAAPISIFNHCLGRFYGDPLHFVAEPHRSVARLVSSHGLSFEEASLCDPHDDDTGTGLRVRSKNGNRNYYVLDELEEIKATAGGQLKPKCTNMRDFRDEHIYQLYCGGVYSLDTPIGKLMSMNTSTYDYQTVVKHMSRI
jgi:hypothetical protein